MEIKIRLLGGFTVWRADEEILDWGSRDACILLKLLLSEPGQIMLSDQLIEQIWPAANPEKALPQLRSKIRQIRMKLEPNSRASDRFIETATGGYRFNTQSDCEIDVMQFLRALSAARQSHDDGEYETAVEKFRETLSVYHGPFLEGDEDLLWTRPHRVRLERKYVEALVMQSDCFARMGQHGRALEQCQRAYAIDKFAEDLYRKAMKLCYVMGNPNHAIAIFQTCKEQLDEIGRAPDIQTEALRDQIESGNVKGIDDKHSPRLLAQASAKSRQHLSEQRDFCERRADVAHTKLYGEHGLSDERCYELVRQWRWPENTFCVHCESDQIRVHGYVGRGFEKRYLCISCDRTFVDRTNTLFANSNLSMSQLFRAILIASSFDSKRDTRNLLIESLQINTRTAAKLCDKLQSHWDAAPGIPQLIDLIRAEVDDASITT